MRPILVPAFVMFVLSCAVVVGAGRQAGAERTVLDGVYTDAQAERGTRAYTEHCSRCHSPDLRGNPEALGLTGTRFVEAWREDSLFSLFDHMATRMPREPLTRLPTQVYLDILSFILQFNGYPAGQQDLTEEQLTHIRFVDMVGPQPIPNLALVRVVGCLTRGAKATWTLTSATEPARDNAGKSTTPEQLRAAADAPLGTAVFDLQNLADVREGFTAESYSGHRVQVKGALVRRQAGERITVTSLESVAGSC